MAKTRDVEELSREELLQVIDHLLKDKKGKEQSLKDRAGKKGLTIELPNGNKVRITAKDIADLSVEVAKGTAKVIKTAARATNSAIQKIQEERRKHADKETQEGQQAGTDSSHPTA